MKLFLLSLLLLISSAMANDHGVLCSLRHSKKAISVARDHSSFDKNRHCSVSCMLALRCDHREVLLVGYLKEFQDSMGDGTPEREDILANKFGISIVKNRRASNDQECLDQCDLRY